MQAITQIFTKNLIITFDPFTMFLEICMQIHSVVFALSRSINKLKVCKTINRLCAGNAIFGKYQLKGVLTPTPLRTPVIMYSCHNLFCTRAKPGWNVRKSNRWTEKASSKQD